MPPAHPFPGMAQCGFNCLGERRRFGETFFMKSFIISLCCILSGGAILAQSPKLPAKSLKTSTGVTQTPATIQSSATKPGLTSKSATTQSPALSQASATSPVYSRMKIKLPFATAEKEYFVQKMGHFFVLNGDIIVGNDFPKTMSYSVDDNDYRWANATLPIVVDPSIYANNLGNEVHRAISMFNNRTELCLVPRGNEKNYIRIVFSSTIAGAGLSSIGCQGGEQALFLSASASQGTVMHELMHAAGFYHEQCREDRDQFIKINGDNIKEGLENNFQTEGGVARGYYDFCSIMHYPKNAFSKNDQPTIECIQNGMTINCPDCIGNRTYFSDDDINGIDKFYSNVSRFPCQASFPNPHAQMQFPNIYPSASQSAMAAFQHRAKLASQEKPFIGGTTTTYADKSGSNLVRFVGAYPNFHEVRKGNNIIGGTIFLKSTTAGWQDIPLAELGNPPLDDFAARMRATQNYAVRNGYVGGFPNFFHKDYGKGIVCGTVLIGNGGAEWRDVSLVELGNPALDNIAARMTTANDYAFKNGYLGGFPTFYHTDYGKGIVCGIILIKKNAGEWRDVVVVEGPK